MAIIYQRNNIGNISDIKMEKHFAKMNPLFPDKNHKQIYPFWTPCIFKNFKTWWHDHELLYYNYLCKLKHRIENMFDLNEVIGTLNKE